MNSQKEYATISELKLIENKVENVEDITKTVAESYSEIKNMFHEINTDVKVIKKGNETFDEFRKRYIEDRKHDQDDKILLAEWKVGIEKDIDAITKGNSKFWDWIQRIVTPVIVAASIALMSYLVVVIKNISPIESNSPPPKTQVKP